MVFRKCPSRVWTNLESVGGPQRSYIRLKGVFVQKLRLWNLKHEHCKYNDGRTAGFQQVNLEKWAQPLGDSIFTWQLEVRISRGSGA